MATYYLVPGATFFQEFTDTGIVGSGLLLWTYTAGTSSPVTTYTDNTGGTPNSNPIVLASNGRLPNVSIWIPSGTSIKVVISTNAGTPSVPVFGVQIGPTYDQLTGINDVAFNTTTGSFTGTLTGMTGSTTGPVSYAIVGKTCILRGAFTGSSNSTSMTMTGVPAACNPATGASFCACMLEDNGSNIGGWAQVTTGNTINFGTGINDNASGFTGSGTKGLPAGWTVVYSLF